MRFVVAGVVCLLHAAVLLGLAVFYGVELVRGEGSSVAAVVMSGALLVVMAALLALLARVWSRRSPRAAVPTLVWNGLLVPVVLALYGAGQTALATGLLVLVAAGVVSAVAAMVGSPGPADRGGPPPPGGG